VPNPEDVKFVRLVLRSRSRKILVGSIIVASAMALLALTAGRDRPSVEVVPLAASEPTISPSDTPNPEPSIPALWPDAVVAAMPTDMKAKYQERFAASAGEASEYFYYADTLEELPVEICLQLASGNEDISYSTASSSPESFAVLMRIQTWADQTRNSSIGVFSNHHMDNPHGYIDFLAMDDDSLVDLSLQLLCPEMTSAWQKVRPDIREMVDADVAQKAEDDYNATHPMVKFDDGAYTVGGSPGMIKPGTYQVSGPIRDCYWERSTPGGSIIANDFITNAPKGVTVTVRSGEGFTSNGCTEDNGPWTAS
jgi:hypothetical protein